MIAIDKFNELYDNCKETIPFSSEWNGTDGNYLLDKMPRFKSARYVRSINDDGRKLVIFGNKRFTSVIFQSSVDPTTCQIILDMVHDDYDETYLFGKDSSEESRLEIILHCLRNKS